MATVKPALGTERAWLAVAAAWIAPLVVGLTARSLGFSLDVPPVAGLLVVAVWLAFIFVLMAWASRATRAI